MIILTPAILPHVAGKDQNAATPATRPATPATGPATTATIMLPFVAKWQVKKYFDI